MAEDNGVTSADWDDFRVFLEVVRSGSFNRAAANLGMTQPTVSRRLMRLEEALGVRLFNRDRRGPRLTVDGHRIFNDASAAQLALTRALNSNSGKSERIEGECKIQMGDGLACYWLTRFLPAFYKHHPNISLRIFSTNESLERRENFDIQIAYVEQTDAESVATRIGTLHFLPFASEEYVARFGKPRTVEDLVHHRLVDMSLFLSEAGMWANWLTGDARSRVMMLGNMSSTLGESVRNGAGIALIGSYGYLLGPNFVPIELGIHFHLPILAVYTRDAEKKWPVRATLEFLRAHVFNLKTMPWFRENYVAPSPDWRRAFHESHAATMGGRDG